MPGSYLNYGKGNRRQKEILAGHRFPEYLGMVRDSYGLPDHRYLQRSSVHWLDHRSFLCTRCLSLPSVQTGSEQEVRRDRPWRDSQILTHNTLEKIGAHLRVGFFFVQSV